MHRTEQGQEKELPKHALDISADELKTLQETDPTLDGIRDTLDGRGSTAGFFRRNGLIHREWVPRGHNGAQMAIEQLVLPLQCRKTVLQLAHQLAGHLGRDKTPAGSYRGSIGQPCTETWLNSARPVGHARRHRTTRGNVHPLSPCQSWMSHSSRSQWTSWVRSHEADLEIAIIILVICDYATHYPEAVPLKSIEAERIAEELIKLFARVGIPEEILTDQGSNFTSQLLAELYRMLRVHPIRTSPYHPQTDGLVEHFNQTVKAMLRRAAVTEGTDWDKMVPYLLFAYREVPQTSTGFSPFELIYGRSVHGPLDVLCQAWEGSKKSEESVVSHVLSMQHKLEQMMDIVKSNLEKAQGWFAARVCRLPATERSFEGGCLPNAKD